MCSENRRALAARLVHYPLRFHQTSSRSQCLCVSELGIVRASSAHPYDTVQVICNDLGIAFFTATVYCLLNQITIDCVTVRPYPSVQCTVFTDYS